MTNRCQKCHFPISIGHEYFFSLYNGKKTATPLCRECYEREVTARARDHVERVEELRRKKINQDDDFDVDEADE